MSNHHTVCFAFRSEAQHSIDDPNFGKSMARAMLEYFNTRQKQAVHLRKWGSTTTITGWVVGSDDAITRQVYVLQEGTGERVSAAEGSNASVDALVNVLRARGYTCIKRSDPT